MNRACEEETSVVNENALRFSIPSKPAPVLEYIKTISSLIGASHILAVREEHDSIKVYFDDKQVFDSLIKNGIHITGYHAKVDYVVPPGNRVILSDIDPAISNYDLMKLLSMYGTIVSPILRPPISSDAEFCHIDFGVRCVYMILNAPLPDKLNFNYGDQLLTVNMRIDDNMTICQSISLYGHAVQSESSNVLATSFNSVPEPPNVEPVNELPRPQRSFSEPPNIILAAEPSIAYDSNSSIPIVVSVQSAASEFDLIQHADYSKLYVKEDQVEHKDLLLKSPRVQKSKVTPTPQAEMQLMSSRTKRSKMTSTTKQIISRNAKKSKITPTSWAAKQITLNAKLRRAKHHRRRRKVRKPMKKAEIHDSSSLNHITFSSISPKKEESLTLPLLVNENVEYKSSSNSLGDNKLKMFLEEVKNRRTPLDVVKKYLGNDYNNKMKGFIDQLNEYSASHHCPSLKLRIGRLIKLLKQTV